MHRLLHSAVACAIVVTAYWLYSLVAVPIIEPTIAGPSGTNGEGGAYESGDSIRIRQFAALFAPDAWELKNPITLENDRILLLLKNYKNSRDGSGKVELDCCTMIFLWDGPAEDEAQRIRQSVVLEAKQGAILQFDKPLDLPRIGRLIGGTLMGPIVIRSQGKLPGPEDDLLIHTNDVQLNEREVWTPNPVEFRWGKNFGRGEDMRIRLLADPSKPAGAFNAPNVSGVETFELRHVRQLHLESVPAASSQSSGGAAPTSAAGPSLPPPSGERALPGSSRGQNEISPSVQGGSAQSPNAEDLPVEITCDGSFIFNVVKRVATFAENVNILRLNPNGPSDQIQGELLSLFFAAPDNSKAGSDNSANLEFERVEARGHPVVICAPTQDLTGRGERLEYNLKTQLISLEGGPDTFLRQGRNEIHAPALQYQYLGPNRLGKAFAKGPGRLTGQMADKPDQRLDARWNDQLRLVPQGENHVISFSGGAALDYSGIGHLQAQEIYFWLKENAQPQNAGRPRIQPDRMMARNKVAVNSPRFSAEVEQLEVWFEQKDSPQGIRWKVEAGGETKDGQGPLDNPPQGSSILRGLPAAQRQIPQPHTAYQIPLPAAPVSYEQVRGAPAEPDPVERHFKISGGVLRARVTTQNEENPALAEITIEDRVRLEESQTAATDERPVLILGDRLHGLDLSYPSATVSIVGNPAHFEGRGIALNGANIHLDRGANRLWIDGPGRMDLPLSSQAAGQALMPGQPINMQGTLVIEWKRRMLFDGRNARFEDSVSATTPRQHLQTDVLEARLRTPFNFSDPSLQNQSRAELEELHCSGGAFLENHSADAGQQITSFDRIVVTDLGMNVQSGELTAGGPGWLNSVTPGASDTSQNPSTANLLMGRPGAQASGGANPPPAANQLYCLHVRFQGSITGNIRQGGLVFHDRVRAAYAPALDWTAMIDPDKQANLGPQGVALQCNQLRVNQMALPGGNGQSIEVEALGNAVAEGQNGVYTARAHRVTFSQAKELLILEGDGRTDAELFIQEQPGGPRKNWAAQKIYYWRKTGSVKTDRMRAIEIDPSKR
jgi:lipopolysaccharide export system protein LptA